jgi:predicted DNA-binding transcriptional regulator AlpA
MSNQLRCDQPANCLPGPTLKQTAGCSWQNSSDPRARPGNGGESIRVHTNSRRDSADGPDGRQEPVISNSQLGSGLQLVQSSDELRNSEFTSNVGTAPVALEHSVSHRSVPRRSCDDPLLNVQEVAARLNVTKDWVWDHSSRKAPHLPVIRMGDGTLRYRASRIEEFIDERERLTNLRRRRG